MQQKERLGSDLAKGMTIFEPYLAQSMFLGTANLGMLVVSRETVLVRHSASLTQ